MSLQLAHERHLSKMCILIEKCAVTFICYYYDCVIAVIVKVLINTIIIFIVGIIILNCIIHFYNFQLSLSYIIVIIINIIAIADILSSLIV